MQFMQVDELVLFIIFFVPGFISIKVHELLVPSDFKDSPKLLLEGVSYSSLNFAILSWVIIPISRPSFYESHPFSFYVLLMLVLFVFPVIWPIILRIILDSSFFDGKILNKYPTGWDGLFAKRKEYWVLVHLKNGKLIGGYYGHGSVASSYPKKQDIYLSEVWKIENDGSFSEIISQTAGVWLDKEAIDYLEFFKKGEDCVESTQNKRQE